MVKKLLFTLFLVLVQTAVFAQTVGDYRSNIVNGNWTSLASWQYYNGSSWVTPSGTSPQGYPGQFTGTGVVTIRNGNNISISVSTPNNFSSLVIGEGISGILTVAADVDVKTLNIKINASGQIKFSGNNEIRFPENASIIINSPGKIDDGGTCNNNVAVYIGTTKYAVCKGAGNAEFSFEEINSSGGSIIANPGNNSSVCGNTIVLSGSYSGAKLADFPVTYKWSGSGLTFSPSDTAQSPSVSSAVSGTYLLRLTVTNGNYSNYKDITIVFNSLPTSPSVEALSQPTCTTSNGSFTIANYNASYTYTVSPSAGVTVSGNTVTAPTGSYTVTATLGTCTSVASSSVVINSQPAAPVQPTLSTPIQPTCTTSNGSFTIANYNASYTYTVSPSAGVTVSGNTVTAPTGSYTVTAKLGTCTSVASSGVVINSQPAVPVQPTLSTPIQPTCTTSNGSFTIANYNASYTYTVSPSAGVMVSGNTVTAPTGSYTVTATLGTCTSVASASVTINAQPTNTWNGSAWSTGLAPTSSEKIIFDGFYSSATNLNGCSCQVNSGKSATILSGGILKITNELTVLGTGTLTFENNSSLVQINDAAINTGNIIYRRQTTPISKFDYTYWSSPVSPQTLYNVSPNTLYDKFFSYNAVSDIWTQENPGNNMVKGAGYIIRGPQNYAAPTPPGLYEANFKGVPNNGIITIPIGGLDSSNLIGNPYPSALDANKFLTDNSAVLDGTLYFWTHNTAIQLASGITNGSAGSGDYAYTSDDYASYNLTGGVGTDGVTYAQGGNVAGTGGQKPSGKIASGQGFFATGKSSGTATFNNNPLGAIIKNVNSSVFCVVKRNKKCIENRF
ncbi:hypothetical protein [Flavobacterium sp. 83]|uniref:hypothetical protein n=1 Tax=Flavobacterium sp. 83 TaxID=1131812 RepID=UPI00068C898E|nr:hypothetical protein [Flavobacterium sp. 83]